MGIVNPAPGRDRLQTLLSGPSEIYLHLSVGIGSG